MSSFTQAKRVVIKVGTSTLTYENGKLNLRCIEKLCHVISDLQNSGKQVVLVSSGAIGVGVGKMKLTERPAESAKRQALAAVGQCELMFIYDKFFSEYDQTVAQVLLTADDIRDTQRRIHVENTFTELLEMNVIPIVNENDTVSIAELEGSNFGDNDNLSAIIADLVDADVLIILTDIDGLYDGNPRVDPQAKRIPYVAEITPEIEALAGDPGTARGTGGMSTKVQAAKYANACGISCCVMCGANPQNLYVLFEGGQIGTIFDKPAKA